ncbi:hypothetical protein P43SY_003501 [Pythium insidiosum]|uniref:phosphopyruvate hydratase n=1 Tax=Pythium insidiosum TaxID=114742 RepID=A0AAD5LGT8_PYTIN|nr:hypothetical protein P43SY_003501 [Pythium insidiosum]
MADDGETRERDVVEAYIQEHALETSLNDVINQVVADRPEDPFLVLSALLYAKATAKRGIFHVQVKEIFDGLGLPGVLVRLHTGKGVFEAASSSDVAGIVDRPELFDAFAPTVPLDKQRFGGQGYRLRAQRAEQLLVDALVNVEPTDQAAIDSSLLVLEPEIGRNVCIAASVAACKAGAKFAEIPLHEYVAQLHEMPMESVCLPMPLFSVLNGGRFGANKLFVRDIFMTPTSATSFADALQLGVEITRAVRQQLELRGVGYHNAGQLGGFAPPFQSPAEAVEVLRAALEETRSRVESTSPSVSLLDPASVSPLRVEFGLDVAASDFCVLAADAPPGDDDETKSTQSYNVDKWFPGSSGQIKSSEEMVEMVRTLVKELGATAVVDPFSASDLKSFATLLSLEHDTEAQDAAGGEASAEASLVQSVGSDPNCRLQVVARDAFELNGADVLHEERACNTVLLQLHQFPSVTRALKAVAEARGLGLAVMLGAAAGHPPCDSAFLAAFTTGAGIGQVMFGGLLAADSADRYNHLLLASEEEASPGFVSTAFRR